MIESQPLFFDGLLYFASIDGKVYAISEERNLAWSLPDGVFRCEGGVTADLFADQQGLYVASRDTKLYCLNRLTGRISWQYFAGEALHRQPLATKDFVYQYVPGKGVVCIDKVVQDETVAPSCSARARRRTRPPIRSSRSTRRPGK
jgi:outer membrane protein assembly factor BamB